MKLFVDGEMRYLGKWRGIVVRTDDPNKQFRIRVKIPELLDEVESNWCLPCFPGSSKNVALPEVGQMVWVEFEQGEVNKPLWVGLFPSSSSGDLPATPEALGVDGVTVKPPRGTLSVEMDESGRVLNEPLPAFTGEYGSVEVKETGGGHHIEVDNTPDAERVAVFSKSATGVEMTAKGSVRVRATRHDLTVTGDRTEQVHGKSIFAFMGPVEMQFAKDLIINVKGKLTKVYNEVKTKFKSPTLEMEVDGSASFKAGGRGVLDIGGNFQQTIAGSLQLGVLGAHNTLVTENSEEIVGNSLASLYGKKITVLVGNFALECTVGEVNINGLTVRLGNQLTAVEPLVLGARFATLFNQLVLLYNTHSHASDGAAPPAQQAQPMVVGYHTSIKSFTE